MKTENYKTASIFIKYKKKKAHFFLRFTIGAFILFNLNLVNYNSFAQVISNGGWGHTVFLCTNSTIYSCGLNNDGQLGNGLTNGMNPNSTPLLLNGYTGITSMAAGGFWTLFVKNNGTAWAFGQNMYGELGDGTTIDKLSPAQVNITGTVTAVSAHWYHSLFLKNDGTAWACGHNLWGRLGDGTTTNRSTPVQVKNITGIRSISAGETHSLFLKSDGTAWACGRNVVGQLGDGTGADKSIVIPVSGMSNITAISAGWKHSLFLKNDGTVWACGDNGQALSYNSGQLGDGTTATRYSPVKVNISGIVTAISAGTHHSLFLKNDSTVWACGKNSDGELGDGTTTTKLIPTKINALSGIVAIAAGESVFNFVKKDGTVWACGANYFGQLGTGDTIQRLTPVQINGLCSVGIGVDEYSTKNVSSIYPNPFSGNFTINFNQTINEASISIKNILGQTIATHNLINTNSATLTIDGVPGLYIVEIKKDYQIIETIRVLKN